MRKMTFHALLITGRVRLILSMRTFWSFIRLLENLNPEVKKYLVTGP